MNTSNIVTLKKLRKMTNEAKAEERRQSLYEKYPELKTMDTAIGELNLQRTLEAIATSSRPNENPFDSSKTDNSIGDNTPTENRDRQTETEKKLESLEKKRQTLLKKYKLKDSDFTPNYDCERCQDEGFVGKIMCPCLKKLIAQTRKEQYALGDLLEREKFATFDASLFSDKKNIAKHTNVTQRDIILLHKEQAEEFVETFPNGESLLFLGDTGLGKTFLCNCIAAALLDKGFFVSYYSHVGLNTLFKENFLFQKSSEIAEQYADLFHVDLLIIDDLLEQTSDSTVAELFGLLDRRLATGKSTIVTTNLSFDEIEDLFGNRIRSRLSTYKKFSFYGDDIRQG